MSTKALFITGTDTGVGKTLVAAALVAAYARSGVNVAGMKPVASGSQRTAEGLRNEDALCLMAQSNVPVPYQLLNPYCFEPAIAPHLAAAEAGVRIELRTLQYAYQLLSRQTDRIIVEGAGGWFVPINEQETLADFAEAIEARIVLVVGVRLGCINHALLTAQAIATAGLECAGWVANTLEPNMPRHLETIQALKERLAAPLLGVIPYDPTPTPSKAAHLFSELPQKSI